MRKNSLYNTIGGILKLILGLLSVPVLTKTIGLESYGLYSSANAILNIALFAEWSIAASVTVFLSKEIVHNLDSLATEKRYDVLSIAAIFVLFLAVVTACIMGFNAGWVASLFDSLTGDEQLLLEKALRVSVGIVVARLVHQFFLGILQANSKYGLLNVITTLYTIVSFSTALLVATLTGNIVLIQTFQAISAILMIGVYYSVCRKFNLFSFSHFTKPRLIRFKEFGLYSTRLWFLAVGTSLFSQGDRLIVLRLFGAELSGVYAAITALCNQVNVISAMPVQPLLPLMSEYYEKATTALKERMEPLFVKSFIVSACIIIPSGAGLIFFSSQITQILFGSQSVNFSSTRLYLIITAFAYVLYSFNAVGYFTLLAIKKDQFTTKTVAFAGIISLFSIYFLSTKFGLLGACLGNFGYSFTLILNVKAAKELNVAKHKLVKEVGYILVVGFLLSLLCIIFDNLLVSIGLYLLLTLFVFEYSQKRLNLLAILTNSKFASIFRRS